jgi:hypothetical protein
MKWVPFINVERHGWSQQELPPERRDVLCKIVAWTDSSHRYRVNDTGGIVVGYLRFAAGDKKCPYFVCGSIPGEWEVVAWCDCLPENFANSVPGWMGAPHLPHPLFPEVVAAR